MAVVGILWASSGLPFPFVVYISFQSLLVTLTHAGFVCGARGRQLARFLFLALAAFPLGFLSWERAAETAALPVSLEEVSAIGIEALETIERSDGLMIRGRLRWAETASLVASATGPVALFVDGTSDPAPISRYLEVSTDEGGISLWRMDDGSLGIRASLLFPSSDPFFGGDQRVGVRGTVARIRSRVAGTISESLDRVSGSAAAMAQALVLGDDSLLDPAIHLRFVRSGTIHLLALSGMHLGIIAGLALLATTPLLGRPRATWLAILLAGAYVALIGPRPGLVRAFLLVTLVAVSRVLDRPQPLHQLLPLVFLIHVLLVPAHLLSVGFTLSYLSLMGITLLVPLVRRWSSRFLPQQIGDPLAAGLGAQLATAPVLITSFGAFYPAGVVASIVMGPLVVLAMTCSLLAAALWMAGFQGIAAVSIPVLKLIDSALAAIAHGFAALPAVRLSVVGLPGVLVLSLAAALLAVAGLREGVRGNDVVLP